MTKQLLLLLGLLCALSHFSCTPDHRQMRDQLEGFLNTHYAGNSRIFDSLLTEHPDSDYLVGLKTYYAIRNGEPPQTPAAVQAFVKVHRQSSDSPFIRMAMGLLAQEGQNQAETEKYARLLEAGPEWDQDKWTDLTLFHLYYEADSAKATAYLYRALALDPNFTPAKIELAYNYSPEVHCAEIIEILESLPESYQDPYVYGDLGRAYYTCGNHQKALGYFSKSLSIIPNFEGYYGQALIAHYVEDDYERAEALYFKAIRYDQYQEFNYSDLGWLYYDLNQVEKAEGYFIQAFDSTQEKYNEIIAFYIQSDQAQKANAMNQGAVTRYGNTYQNEGLRILINYTLDDARKQELLRELQHYKEAYGAEANAWLENMMTTMTRPRPMPRITLPEILGGERKEI